MFAGISGHYDLINSLLSFRRDHWWRQFAAIQASVKPGGIVLDVATGTGELARHLSRLNDGSTVIGVDFCHEMLLRARNKLASPDRENSVHLVIGDALKLPFSDSIFDAVTVGFALRNVADLKSAFGEIARVVKPGGRVVSLELYQPPTRAISVLYNLLLFLVARWIGALISGSREAYHYLPASIVEFSTPEEVNETMESAGLRNIEIHRLTLGIAAVHIATGSE
ncbi:MAG: ubiquinone/menaquinone biosynthesis methyltransferase [Dehalococcoidia bacterium]|nr:MAG: ubiquinone/menaquinone biosynthesis methyltransferase [Dehalococcoidia bacterium]